MSLIKAENLALLSIEDKSLILFTIINLVVVYDLSTGSIVAKKFLELPAASSTEKDINTSTIDNPITTEKDIATNDNNSTGFKVLQHIRESILSKDNKKVALLTDGKQLIVLDTLSLNTLYTRDLNKRPIGVTFNQDGSELVTADKFGDAYRICVNEGGKEYPEPVVGHVSVLLDVELTPNDQYLLTSDRDEKIRVSYYPNGYNIHTFLLGHTEFISKIIIPNSQCNIVISGGGSPFLLCHDYQTGKIMDKLELSDKVIFKDLDEVIACSFIKSNNSNNKNEESLVVAGFDGFSGVLVYKLDSNTQHTVLIDALNLTDPPTSATFDSNNNLLVMVQPNQIKKYQLVNSKFEECELDVKVNQTINELINEAKDCNLTEVKYIKVKEYGKLRINVDENEVDDENENEKPIKKKRDH